MLVDALRKEIAAHGGWISFARYMELAVQAYYGRSDRQFGTQGDFVTAPELGSLFGRTLARQIAQIEGPILELGAGTGALAETLLKELERDYLILETSGALRSRQAARLGGKVKFLDRLPEAFRGVVIANEVVDAMPVHAVRWKGTGVFERGVAFSEKPIWEERPASGTLLDEAGKIEVPAPYDSELGLAGQAWMRSLAAHLAEGVVFIIDYGFPRREYYHPQRSMGTLMCHARHRAHGDPFERPGEQDITAHVDFSALARAARAGGLEVLGYATQAQFLVNCGITDVLAQANIENALHYAPIAAEAQKLLSPAEMGELFKVLAVGRGVKQPLLGFSRGERSNTL
ncbi:MAG TPA: SAM-dependent methyltransferase [Burkholderiales bacterium]|nr:SAM-dependent methyltransferase [Burkholderiales bacterium]